MSCLVHSHVTLLYRFVCTKLSFLLIVLGMFSSVFLQIAFFREKFLYILHTLTPTPC